MSVECAMRFEFHPFVGAAFPHAGTRAAKTENRLTQLTHFSMIGM